MKTLIYILFFVATNGAYAQFQSDPNSTSEVRERLAEDLLLFKQLAEHKQKQGSNFLTVGPGISCDTNTIQNAIDAEVDEIRVTNNQTYFENIVIDDRSVMLRGGFADCDEANENNQTDTYTQVNGGNTDPVIEVEGGSQVNVIVLENLNIRDGSSLAGAGIQVRQSFSGSVFLNNSIMQFNDGINGGGGIFFPSGAEDINLVIINTEISNNKTVNGGGLMCFGTRAKVILAGNTKINLNLSEINNSSGSGTGGGLHISGGCEVNMYGGVKINNNNAESGGGGIYITGDSSINGFSEYCDNGMCIGDNTDLVEIRNNVAGFPALNEDGGGIFVNGSDVSIFGGFHMIGNRARFGAGIYAENEASIFMSASSQVQCLVSTQCVLFSGNVTTSVNGVGGAIYSKDSEIEINHAYFEDNRADTATAIYSTGQGTITRIENSIFTHNGNDGTSGYNDLYVLRAFSGARFDITYSTFADNHANTTFGINNSSNTLNLSSSIVHDPSSGDVLVNDNANIQINCVMAHEVSSISGNILSLNNPNFVDRASRDFHLAAGSPAIDYCNELGMSVFPLVDIDFDQRGVDEPTAVNNFANSFYDIGADEFNDLIFANGFEPIPN